MKRLLRSLLCLLGGHRWVFHGYFKWNEELLPCGVYFRCIHCGRERTRYFQSEIRRRRRDEAFHARIDARIHQQYIQGLATTPRQETKND